MKETCCNDVNKVHEIWDNFDVTNNDISMKTITKNVINVWVYALQNTLQNMMAHSCAREVAARRENLYMDWQCLQKAGTRTVFWYFPPSNRFQVRVVRQKGEFRAFKSKEFKVTMKKVHNTLLRRPESFVFTACSWNKCLKKAQGFR